MGLYSTVAKPMLSFEESAQIDRLLDESYDFSQGITHLMEFVTMVDENDHQLFNSLIECDFITATNEAFLNEEGDPGTGLAVIQKTDGIKKEKIGDKIKAVLAKAKEFFIKVGQQLITKITDLIKSDKKIYDSYKGVLKADNLKGFGGIKDYTFQYINKNAGSSISDYRSVLNKFAYDFEHIASKEDASSKLNAFRDESEEFVKKFRKTIDDVNGKEASFVPNQSQIDIALNTINNAKDIISNIKSNVKSCIDQIKYLETIAKASLKSKEEKSELETFKMNELSQIISGATRAMSQLFSDYTRLCVKQVAAHRKLVIVCGHYAAKVAKGEEKKTATEESFDWFLCESSDDFVMEHFAY